MAKIPKRKQQPKDGCPFAITGLDGVGILCRLPAGHAGMHQVGGKYAGLDMVVRWAPEFEATRAEAMQGDWWEAWLAGTKWDVDVNEEKAFKVI